MAIEASDWTWLDPLRRIAQAELADMCHLSPAELDELVDYGALVPLVGDAAGQRQFGASCVGPLREAARLRAHYDLDLFTVSLVLGYLQRIAQLEQQLRGVHSHLPGPAHLPREGPTPWREPHA
jgi:chaperone modulatory protein CbpM